MYIEKTKFNETIPIEKNIVKVTKIISNKKKLSEGNHIIFANLNIIIIVFFHIVTIVTKSSTPFLLFHADKIHIGHNYHCSRG